MGKLGGLVTPPSCPDPKQGVCAFILLNRTVWLMTQVGMQGRYVNTRHHQLSEPAGRVVPEPKGSPSKRPAGTRHWKHSDGGSWGRRCREMLKWDVRVLGHSMDRAHVRRKKI